jgi:tetratricopeptide (TPR) repeat protein
MSFNTADNFHRRALDFVSAANHAFGLGMNSFLNRKFLAVAAGIIFTANLFAQETNAPQGITREEVANNYLHIQEQIHESQLAIVQNQQAALDAAKSNSDALTARIGLLEKAIADQRTADTDAAHKTQQTTLFLAGAFGLAGLGIMLLMVYFQWRAFTQLAQISSQQHAALAQASAVHQLAAPGRATVETANAQLLDVVGRLEKRINELEGGQKFLPEISASGATVSVSGNSNQPNDLLSEGQKHLDANAPLKALECFDKFLTAHPERAEALVKRAAALEKLNREDEALNCYNRAIAADGSFVIAHLHKGGLLNRLRRYDEALNCYEQALLAQEKKGK